MILNTRIVTKTFGTCIHCSNYSCECTRCDESGIVRLYRSVDFTFCRKCFLEFRRRKRLINYWSDCIYHCMIDNP